MIPSLHPPRMTQCTPAPQVHPVSRLGAHRCIILKAQLFVGEDEEAHQKLPSSL